MDDDTKLLLSLLAETREELKTVRGARQYCLGVIATQQEELDRLKADLAKHATAANPEARK